MSSIGLVKDELGLASGSGLGLVKDKLGLVLEEY